MAVPLIWNHPQSDGLFKKYKPFFRSWTNKARAAWAMVTGGGVLHLLYWQSSSMKQLFHNCNRIEAEQQSDGAKGKSSMNLILRILLIAERLSCNPESWRHSFFSFLKSFSCISLLYISCTRVSVSLSADIYMNFLLYDKLQNCIYPIDVRIKST